MSHGSSTTRIMQFDTGSNRSEPNERLKAEAEHAAAPLFQMWGSDGRIRWSGPFYPQISNTYITTEGHNPKFKIFPISLLRRCFETPDLCLRLSPPGSFDPRKMTAMLDKEPTVAPLLITGDFPAKLRSWEDEIKAVIEDMSAKTEVMEKEKKETHEKIDEMEKEKKEMRNKMMDIEKEIHRLQFLEEELTNKLSRYERTKGSIEVLLAGLERNQENARIAKELFVPWTQGQVEKDMQRVLECSGELSSEELIDEIDLEIAVALEEFDDLSFTEQEGAVKTNTVAENIRLPSSRIRFRPRHLDPYI